MKKLLLTTAALCAFAAPAYAGTICFGTPDNCGGDTEHKIFLDAGSGATGNGQVGSQTGTPTVDFSSGGQTLDYKNGWANVDPHGSGKSFSTFDVTVPGYDFTDLVYSAAMYKNGGSPMRCRSPSPSSTMASRWGPTPTTTSPTTPTSNMT